MNIRKKIIIIMVLIMGVIMIACKSIDSGIVNTTLNKLENKYDCSFKATHLGNRLNYSTATVNLVDDEGVTFSAELDSDSGEVTDNYIRQKNAFKMNNEIVSDFKELDVRLNSSIVFMCEKSTDLETDRNISLSEFCKKYQVEDVFLYLCLNQADVSKEKMKLLCSKFQEYSSKNKLKFSASMFIISETKFDDCIKEMKQTPDVTNTLFDDYTNLPMVKVCFDKDSTNPSVDSIVKQLTTR